MKPTAIAGISLMIVILLVAPLKGRAEAPAESATAAETAGNAARIDTATIGPNEKLTVDRCVEIALHNNPNIFAASHTVNATWERVGQAWSAYYPQISLAGNYTRSDTLISPSPYGIAPNQDNYAWSATLNQNIIDFGRTNAQVAIRQKDLDASREDLRDATKQIVFNVKSAYYGLLRAEKVRDVLTETVALFEKQLDQARKFFEAGVKSRFDVTNAEVELSNAKINLIRAENERRIARVTLNNAMGAPDAPEYTIEDSLSFQKIVITLEEARETAFVNRPDIRSSAARREAAENTLSLARKGHFPVLSGNANYTKYSGETYPAYEDSSWMIGLTLTLPLFSGFLTSHQVGEARENVSVSKANEEALRQKVLLDVQQAYFKMLEAEERVGVAELTVKQAEDNYELAHGRYEQGVGIPLEETNALVNLSNARTNLVSALADYKVAEAELRRAMGD